MGKRPAPKRPKKSGRGGARPNSGGARKGAGRKRMVRRVADFQSLGNAPEDELERLRWMSAALGVRARQVMLDEKMSDERRGGELRSLARTMNALVTKARLRRAELAVRGEAADMKRPIADPPVGPRPKPEGSDGT